MNKKWLIGCGGCLGVSVLLIVAVCVGGWLWYDSSTKQATSGIFGEKQPPGYTTLFALPIKDTTMAMMMDMATQRMMFAIAAPLKEGDLQAMTSGNTQQVESYIQGAMSQQGSNNVRGMDFVGLAKVKAPEGGDAQLLNFRMEIEEQGFMPMSLALLPVAEGKRMNMLIVMDMKAANTDPNTDFTQDFVVLNQHLGDIIATTDVAKGLVKTQGIQEAPPAASAAPSATGAAPPAMPAEPAAH